MNDMTEKMFERLTHKLAETRGKRLDLEICDASVLSELGAKVLMRYSSAVGIPSFDSVREFFASQYQGELIPSPEYFRCFPEKEALEVVVSRLQVKREYNDRNIMTPIVSEVKYIDDDKNVWSVKETEGKKILIRNEKQDIEQLLKINDSPVQNKTATLHYKDASSVGNRVNVGDEIKIFMNGIVIRAVVSTQPALGMLEVIDNKGNRFAISVNSVLEVVTPGAETKKQLKDEVYEYFVKVYGPDYAAQMVENV